MQKQLLFIACVLFTLGCSKTDISLDDTSIQENKSVKGSSTTVGTFCDVISFNNVSAGTLLTQVNSDEGRGPITMTSFNSRSPEQPVAAIVFNSANPHQEDVDLGTPNQAFGGPGVGAGGASGPYVNNTPLGNIVVIQNFVEYGTIPNDDDVEGYITFNFSNIGPITATSLTVIDVESNEGESITVNLYNQQGGTLLYTTTFNNTDANGVGVINLNNTPGVGYIQVLIDGSIGIDNLAFCVNEQPRVQCTYTQGYWKNHPEVWPVSSLTLGSVTYTKAQLSEILRTPVRGNGLISLAHQLIAAKLNIANGSSNTAVASYITSADALIGNRVIPPVGSGYLHPSQTSSLNDKLTDYNEGRIGPGHCDK